MRRALAAAALLALAAPAGASAHASLVGARPDYGQRVERSPAALSLVFDQGVQVPGARIDVVDARGREFAYALQRTADPRVLIAPLRRLPRGGYTVRWRALSADGHVVAGVYTFGVRAVAPPQTSAYGAEGPSKTEDAMRWLYFASLALLLGALVFRLVVLPREVPQRVARRFWAIAAIGVVANLEVGILAFLLRAENVLQLPFQELLYGDLSPLASGTRFGTAFTGMTLGFAFVATLLFLSWLTDRDELLWPALALSLALASGLSLSGHSSNDPWRVQAADWVHLSAASVWAGGLVVLAVAVWPVAPALRRDAFLRFSRLATGLVALLLAAGVYLAIERLPAVDDLWHARYGHVLLVKLALVAVALGWGAFHHFVARPALERGEGGVLQRLPRSLVGESLVGMAVLLVAAVLVNSEPPPPAGSPPAQVAGTSP